MAQYTGTSALRPQKIRKRFSRIRRSDALEGAAQSLSGNTAFDSNKRFRIAQFRNVKEYWQGRARRVAIAKQAKMIPYSNP